MSFHNHEPEEYNQKFGVKARLEAEKKKKESEKFDDHDFLNKLIDLKLPAELINEYEVKFYDDPFILVVKANNFTTAGVLGMAWKIHKDAVGFGIEWIKSRKTGNKVPFDIKD